MNYDEHYSRRVHQLAVRLGVSLDEFRQDGDPDGDISIGADVLLLEAIVDRLPPARQIEERPHKGATFSGSNGNQIRVEVHEDGSSLLATKLRFGEIESVVELNHALTKKLATMLMGETT